MNKNTIKRIAACAAAVAAFSAFGGEVAADEAREAARGWATLQEALTGKERFAGAEIADVKSYEGKDGRGRFYVVSFEGGGFAVTSGDTEIAPSLRNPRRPKNISKLPNLPRRPIDFIRQFW